MYFESKSPVSFAEFYLEHRCYISEQDDAARFLLRDQITAIRGLYGDEQVSEGVIIRLLSELGDNVYLDRYIVGLVVKHQAQLMGGSLEDVLKSMLANPSNTSHKLAQLLDICMECDQSLLSGDVLFTAFSQYRHDFDSLSVLIEYVRHFLIEDVADLLFDYLGEVLPENIKMQIIDYLVVCNPNKTNRRSQIKQKLLSEKHINLYLAYLKFITQGRLIKEAGIIVIQSMFYGDPEFSGIGQSGGLGTLLKTLGNQLTKHEQIAQVITLTINNDWHEQKPFMSHYDNGHWLIRLPLHLDMEDPDVFVKKELSIKRAVARFLKQWQVKPDIFHVRYLDNASKAMANLSKEMQAKLVFTLTPDPHRNMADEDGSIACFKVEETLAKLNKISIGDELLAMTHGIVGIGGDAVRRELQLYFPQLNQHDSQVDFQMIGEGIRTDINMHQFDVWQLLEDHALGFCIDPLYREKPIILNVGRLSWQKGQHHLIQAWGESQLWRDYNLVVIGGSQENEDDEEQKLKASFESYMASKPHLKGRFAHVEALPNEMIRQVERKMMTHGLRPYPNLYVCSSAKEEFGISILEALSEGFLVFAPIKGGVKTYIAHGVNGFLVDTTNASTLLKAIEKVMYHSHRRHEDFEIIKDRGQRTVLDHFSMEEIAKHFITLYLGLSQEDELLCVLNTSSF
jgi:glycosyltransferase involved in cell wall biosynthesis